MRKLRASIICALGLLFTAYLYAQSIPGTLVQQSPTRLDSPTNCSTGTGAAAAAVTVTITPTGSNTVYLTYLEVTNYVSATETGNAAPNLVTITGITGSPVISMATAGATVGAAVDRYIASFVPAVKATAPGTNVVITTPAFTGAIWRVNACYYFAP